MTFTPEVYEQIREGARRSAAVIVPYVYELLEPLTVLDVGCGEGFFAEEFARHECVVTAIDESVDGIRKVGAPEYGDGLLTFRHADLVGDAWAYDLDRITEGRGFDLAVCLEVAEHLPEGVADAFVETLCALAPVVLFSAAIPGQGGHGHLNEQWPAFWVERFARHGFDVSGSLRWQIWGCDGVEPWYQENLLVAAHLERARALLPDYAVNYGLNEIFGEHAFSDPIPVVHPTIWEHRRQRP